MDVVKRERVKVWKFKVGEKVSVPRTYFDDDYNVDIYTGVVQSVSDINKTVRVKWDLDGAFTNVKIEELSLYEPPQSEVAVPDTHIIPDNDDEPDFNASVSTSKQPTCSTKAPEATVANTEKGEQKKNKKKFQLRVKPKQAYLETDSSDDEGVIAKLTEKNKKKKNVNKKGQKRKSNNENETANVRSKRITKSNSTEEESDESTNELDYGDEGSSSEEELPAGQKKAQIDIERALWDKSGWNIDPINEKGHQPYGPRMAADNFSSMSELLMCFQFLPLNFFRDETLPATNCSAKEKYGDAFKEITLDEFLHLLGLIYSMEVQKLPERRMYWSTTDDGIFKGMNYGAVMSRDRFESILINLKLSKSENKDQQILDFIDAINSTFQNAMTAGDFLCLDESMIKSYHRNLKGKMKIIRKPRPIGNELKNLCDARSKIVLNIELYEGRELMATKEHVDRVGATTATCLRLTEPWKGTGRIVVGDSWFGSVKSAKELLEANGLYSIMLVKTAYKNYPKSLLREKMLVNRGEWNAVSASIDGTKMMAVLFKDLKEKQFVSTCSTSLEGKPRKTKHHGLIKRPKVAEQYLQMAAGIDIHNHVRTGSLGLEDVWSTHNYIHRQFAGILGFAFTNAFLAATYFQRVQNEKVSLKYNHVNFKIKLANQMVQYKEIQSRPSRGMPELVNTVCRQGHVMISLGKRSKVGVMSVDMVQRLVMKE